MSLSHSALIEHGGMLTALQQVVQHFVLNDETGRSPRRFGQRTLYDVDGVRRDPEASGVFVMPGLEVPGNGVPSDPAHVATNPGTRFHALPVGGERRWGVNAVRPVWRGEIVASHEGKQPEAVAHE